MTFTIKLQPDVISWIIDHIDNENTSPADLELLNLWESGQKLPTLKQIEKVSKKINIPFGYFFLDTPPIEQCHLADFRTVKSEGIYKPSRNLVSTIYSTKRIQNWMREYVISTGLDILDFVGSCKETVSIPLVVKSIRQILNLQSNWFEEVSNSRQAYKYIREHLEYAGVLVLSSGIVANNTRRKLDINEFRAFTLVDKYAPLIFINNCDSDNGKTFSLLHETAHIWMGIDSMYNDLTSSAKVLNKIEARCNAVAAELIVPAKCFRDYWKSIDGNLINKIQKIAGIFHCSNFVILRRANTEKFISDEVYKKEYHHLLEEYRHEIFTKKNSGGGNYYNSLSNRFSHRLIHALEESAQVGRTQYTEVYRLTNTNRSTFQNLLQSIGG